MRNIRKLIREMLSEIFDNPTLPGNLEVAEFPDKTFYKFKKSHDYCVAFIKNTSQFQPIGLTNDEKSNNAINNSKEVFYSSWGICDGNDLPSDDVETGAKEEIYVFNSVFAIIQKFLQDKNPDVIFYKAIKKRKEIYNKIFNKLMSNNYYQQGGVMNTFLIKKELIK
jgi:hypothetical protein